MINVETRHIKCFKKTYKLRRINKLYEERKRHTWFTVVSDSDENALNRLGVNMNAK